MVLNLIFLGPNNAGKGTVAESVQKSHNLLQISTGDWVRAEIKAGSEFGKVVKSYSERGELVPDEVMISYVESKLKPIYASLGVNGYNGIIFDGFPRTAKQAEMFEVTLGRLNERLDGVVFIDASKKVVVERSANRRVCKSCGTVYNVKSKPSKKEGICDKDGGELHRRPDDEPQTAAKRYDDFIKTTLPLVKYFKKRKLLYRYDGNVSIEKSLKLAESKIGLIVKRSEVLRKRRVQKIKILRNVVKAKRVIKKVSSRLRLK